MSEQVEIELRSTNATRKFAPSRLYLNHLPRAGDVIEGMGRKFTVRVTEVMHRPYPLPPVVTVEDGDL